jgi:DAACS family dicarboxylate/amino acid:cation (Na+ or H+) symporter
MDETVSHVSESKVATRILIGLALGAAVGLAVNFGAGPEGGEEAGDGYRAALWFADNVANPVGQVFLRMLFMTVVPLVFTSLVLGVSSLGDLGRIGRVGLKSMVWFLGSTLLAIALGLTLVNTLRPGDAIDRQQAEAIVAQFATEADKRIEQGKQGTGFTVDTFVNMVPKNVLRSAADDREMLGLIFFALMMGIAATRLHREKVASFLDVLRALYDLCVVLLGFAMKLAPFGVFGLIYAVTVRLGFDVIRALGAYLGVALSGLLIHQFVTLGLLAFIFVGIRPAAFFRRIRGLMVTAFSTSSSNATLPTTMRTANEEFGVPESVAGFVMPLGATMNMNGTALFEGICVLFLAQVAGIDLSLGQQALVVLLAMLSAIGAAGVPGGSLPLLAVVLSQVGVDPALLGLVLGVDRIVDMTRTVPNVTSDLLCSMWVAKSEGTPLKT